MVIKRVKTLELEALAAFAPPYDIFHPARLTTQMVFASPHSGHIYPESFLRRSSLRLSDIQRNEDIFIDALFKPVQDLGAPLLAARFPRCFLDVNRAADEIPDHWAGSAPTTPRANMGLGVIPTIISEKKTIYDKPLKPSVIKARLGALYYPYHAALRTLLNDAQKEFGRALLIDCHSMPGYSASGKKRPDIILGDRYGVSCYPDTIARVEAAFTARGYTVTRNHPYAGGFVTSHYGQPETGIEAVQIEINRELYVNAVTRAKTKTYDKLAADLMVIVSDLIEDFDQNTLEAAQ